MEFNIANPTTGRQKKLEIDDDQNLPPFFDIRISQKDPGDALLREFRSSQKAGAALRREFTRYLRSQEAGDALGREFTRYLRSQEAGDALGREFRRDIRSQEVAADVLGEVVCNIPEEQKFQKEQKEEQKDRQVC